MKIKNELDTRRSLLKKTTAAAIGIGAAAVVRGQTAHAQSAILPTPEQTSGPFYPVEDQLDKDADLTRINGSTGTALGELFNLQGRLVSATSGQPIAGALIEFWQACASGRYNHPDDTNPAELDPNFQYWAQVRTDAQGNFSILTIIPGAYPATPDWTRPPHIHVRVAAVGFRSLTTQLYFLGHPLNASDRILQSLSPEQQAAVTVEVKFGTSIPRWQVALLPKSAMWVASDTIATPEIP